MSPEFSSFLSGLLQKHPRRRLSWPDVMQHQWVLDLLGYNLGAINRLPSHAMRLREAVPDMFGAPFRDLYSANRQPEKRVQPISAEYDSSRSRHNGGGTESELVEKPQGTANQVTATIRSPTATAAVDGGLRRNYGTHQPLRRPMDHGADPYRPYNSQKGHKPRTGAEEGKIDKLAQVTRILIVGVLCMGGGGGGEYVQCDASICLSQENTIGPSPLEYFTAQLGAVAQTKKVPTQTIVGLETTEQVIVETKIAASLPPPNPSTLVDEIAPTPPVVVVVGIPVGDEDDKSQNLPARPPRKGEKMNPDLNLHLVFVRFIKSCVCVCV